MPVTDAERLRSTRAFFAARAATWDSRFGDDLPAYAAAVAEAGIRRGARVADVGCGTGRALPALRAAVGPEGAVLALDATAEMLFAAAARSADCDAPLVQADALHLPVLTGALGAVFAAGLINHLPDPAAGLVELGRVTATGGRLVLFHPTGRAALAARHGRTLRPDETLAGPVLTGLLECTGWALLRYDDAAERFFALAERVGS